MDVAIENFTGQYDDRAIGSVAYQDNGLGRKAKFLEGISQPSGIFSSAHTSAFVHAEDAELCSINYHVAGHDKVHIDFLIIFRLLMVLIHALWWGRDDSDATVRVHADLVYCPLFQGFGIREVSGVKVWTVS